MARPVIYVLAGVNGAGKSSVGGAALANAGLSWFNPDSFARALVQTDKQEQQQANAAAWHEGMQRLNAALACGGSYAFETTLAGNTVPKRLRQAALSHEVRMWFCGLTSPELHIERVRARVQAGGHAIDEAKIRERYPAALTNLIDLLPHLASLQVYDNSVEAVPGEQVPDPLRLAHWRAGQLIWPSPHDTQTLRDTPAWARPVLEAMFGFARQA